MAEFGIGNAILALALLLVPLTISLRQGLKLQGPMLIAAARAVFQLVVLAYLLAIAFTIPAFWPPLLILALLVAITTKLLSNRLSLDLPPIKIAIALLLSIGLPLTYAVLVVIQPDPWFAPQYWVPLGSALLAQALTVGAAADGFGRSLQRSRPEIEAHLSLGATPAQAVRGYRQAALRAAMVPSLQTMAIAGLGNLPLFLGGQLIAGADPLNAVLYELLLVLLLISSGSGVVLLLCGLMERSSFTPREQLKDSL